VIEISVSSTSTTAEKNKKKTGFNRPNFCVAFTAFSERGVKIRKMAGDPHRTPLPMFRCVASPQSLLFWFTRGVPGWPGPLILCVGKVLTTHWPPVCVCVCLMKGTTGGGGPGRFRHSRTNSDAHSPTVTVGARLSSDWAGHTRIPTHRTAHWFRGREDSSEGMGKSPGGRLSTVIARVGCVTVILKANT